MWTGGDASYVRLRPLSDAWKQYTPSQEWLIYGGVLPARNITCHGMYETQQARCLERNDVCFVSFALCNQSSFRQ